MITPEDRREQIIDLEKKIEKLKEGCPHYPYHAEWSGTAYCKGCGVEMGQYCEESPTKLCEGVWVDGRGESYFDKIAGGEARCKHCDTPTYKGF